MRTAIVIALTLATSASATTMWEQADRWSCALERHMRVPGGADAVDMDSNGLSFGIDFKAGTLSSAFIDGAAPIVERHYVAAQGSSSNVLVARWESGDYPVVIQNYDGNFWQIAGSGTLEPGDEVWLAMYRCTPDPGDS